MVVVQVGHGFQHRHVSLDQVVSNSVTLVTLKRKAPNVDAGHCVVVTPTGCVFESRLVGTVEG